MVTWSADFKSSFVAVNSEPGEYKTDWRRGVDGTVTRRWQLVFLLQRYRLLPHEGLLIFQSIQARLDTCSGLNFLFDCYFWGRSCFCQIRFMRLDSTGVFCSYNSHTLRQQTMFDGRSGKRTERKLRVVVDSSLERAFNKYILNGDKILLDCSPALSFYL